MLGGVAKVPRAKHVESYGGKAQVLQIGEGDTGHQGVPVKTCPGAAFEVAQPQFLLELLVALLAHPARLDRGRQGAG